MTEWQSFVESPPEVGRKFIALYNDGSGAAMFLRTDCGFIDCDGDELTEIGESLDLWTYLPHDKEFWCEIRSEDPMTLYAIPSAQGKTP